MHNFTSSYESSVLDLNITYMYLIVVIFCVSWFATQKDWTMPGTIVWCKKGYIFKSSPIYITKSLLYLSSFVLRCLPAKNEKTGLPTATVDSSSSVTQC